MSGITLSTTTLAAQIEATVSAASQTVTGPGGMTTKSTLDTQLSVLTDLRTSVTKLDPETAAAIVGSVTASMTGPGHLAAQLAPMLNGVLADLSTAMSQGQGAFFFNLTTPGGSGAMGAVTPSEAAAIVAGHGPVFGSINGYSVGAALRTAFSQKPKAGQSATAATPTPPPPPDDPKATIAHMALELLESKGPSSGAKNAAAATPGDDAAQQIRSLASELASATASETPSIDDDSTASLTIIYVPPAETDTTEIETAQSVSTETTSVLNIQA
jgi:hypothetical protein